MTMTNPSVPTTSTSWVGALESLAAQTVGAPSADYIAQLANQFFSALPGQVSPDTPLTQAQLPWPSQPLDTPLPTSTIPSSPTSLPLSGQPQALPNTSSLGYLPTQAVPSSVAAVNIQAVPSTLEGAMSFIRPLPTAAPGLPAGSLYFVEEALATANTTPFQFKTFSFRPESVEYNPTNVPDLGFKPRPFDPQAIRNDFPILQERVHGKRLVWLDNAATTQKPQVVIDRLAYFYEHENSNIHRAAHTLAARATDAYEAARDKVRRFINAGSAEEIVFVRGTTEGINLIAQSWGRQNIGKDDEIVITWLEHHANIVPWQQLAAEKGARLRVAPVDDSGQVILAEYEKLLNPRTKLVSITQVSNALGTITPATEMVAAAHRHGACVVVDGAQSVSHMPTDVQALNCDFFVFSGHKVFGPTGIGVVYGRKEILDNTPPWQGGGNMIADVTFERTIYQAAPARFEAGTGNIADAVGLGAALDYISAIGLQNVSLYEHELLQYATEGVKTVPGLKIIGTAQEKAGVLSFILDGIRTQDVGEALDKEGIAVRSGHHCAQPILRRFGVESTVRASFAPYNTCEDADALVQALLRIRSHHGN